MLSQKYPNFEYIIIDGGSTDQSIEVIRRYERHLAYWVSEPDSGQSQALNKGFARASGEILAWLNSDDLYETYALREAAKAFASNPNSGLVYGDYTLLYPDGTTKLKKKISFNYNVCLYSYLMIPQPSSFFRATDFRRVGGIDERLRYAMDYDLFLRMATAETQMIHIRKSLSRFRLHEHSKSVNHMEHFKSEGRAVRERILGRRWGRKDQVRHFTSLAEAVLMFLFQRGEPVLRKEKGKA